MKNLKKNIREWVSTILGVLVFGTGLFAYLTDKTDIIGLGGLLVLGWVFFTAKDQLIEDMFLNFFSVRRKRNKD